MNDQECITVIMPAYNALPYIQDSIESVLNQTYSNFKLLVLNDGSTDFTLEYLLSIKDPRVTIYNQENKGAGFSANRLIELCDTKWCARLDADDICEPNRLKWQMEYIQQHPDIVLVGSKYCFFTPEGEIKATFVPVSDREIKQRLESAKAAFCHSSIMFDCNVAKQIGGYRIPGAGEDFDFVLRMAEYGPVANIEQCAIKYRLSNGSYSVRARDEVRCGTEYTIKSHELRCNGFDDIVYEDFRAAWYRERTNFQKICALIDDISFSLYRNSLIHRCGNRTLKGTGLLMLAALMRPKDVVPHLTYRLKSGLGGK